MITETRLYQAFDTIKPHIDSILSTLSSYGIGATTLEFYKGGAQMHVFNDICNDENQILTIEYTQPVEERIELSRQRVAKGVA